MDPLRSLGARQCCSISRHYMSAPGAASLTVRCHLQLQETLGAACQVRGALVFLPCAAEGHVTR